VPLCYPLVVGCGIENLKKKLCGKGINIATYWPESRARVFDGIERRLTSCCLAVPCDQRYSADQIAYVAGEIVSGLQQRRLSDANSGNASTRSFQEER
jgi:hypothetical protein